MAIVTSQKITTYYERYKSIEVTFTKEIIQVTGLVTQQVFLKCVGDFWPCVVYASSFEGAKIVANVKSALVEKLQKANNMASLRLCFKNSDSDSTVTFFVSTRMAGFAPYGDSKDMAMFTLQFTQRPPDDLIEIMGRLLDANVNSVKRKDEPILITPDSVRRMKLLAREAAVFIEEAPQHCMLRALSFAGSKLVMMGDAASLVEKESSLRLDFEEPRESFLIRGKFAHPEDVEGREDLVALVMQFDEAQVPMGYKMRINDFLSQVRVDNRSGGDNSPVPVVSKPKAVTPAPDAAHQETLDAGTST
ncbi:cyclic di-GMP binding protein [Spirochaetia bacterium]|nr:cyclic di-GMP binding protein [Spirochaetia bacterium]